MLSSLLLNATCCNVQRLTVSQFPLERIIYLDYSITIHTEKYFNTDTVSVTYTHVCTVANVELHFKIKKYDSLDERCICTQYTQIIFTYSLTSFHLLHIGIGLQCCTSVTTFLTCMFSGRRLRWITPLCWR